MYRRSPLLLVGLIVSVATVGADDRALFEEAQRRFSSGAYQLAIEQLETLLQEYPGSSLTTAAQVRIAQSHFYLGDLDVALEIFQRAAVRARGDRSLRQEIRFWTGMTRYRLGAYEEAIGDFDAYLDEPDDDARRIPRSLLYRGLARREQGDLPGARDDLSAAHSGLEGSEASYARTILLSILSDLDRNEEILAFAEEVPPAELDRSHQEAAYRVVADAAFVLDRVDTAEGYYRELAGYSSAAAQWAYQRLYEIAASRNDRAAMDAIYREAEQRLAAEPERLSAFWLALGADAITSGRFELAEFYLSRLWSLRGERSISGIVPLYLARSLEEQGRTDEAIEILESSLDDPGVNSERLKERYLDVTRMLLSAGDAVRGRNVIERYEGYADDPQTLYIWSVATYRAGDDATVRSVLSRSETDALSRDVPAIMRVYARTLLEEGDAREAVPVYRRYLALRPGDLAVKVELIRALVSAEQFAAALQEIDGIAEDELTAAQENEIAYLRGIGLFHRRDYPAALETFLSVDDNAYEPMLSYHVAWSLYRTGSIAEAGRTIAAVRGALPERLYVDGSYLYAWSLYQQRRTAETIEVLLPLLGSAPSDAQRVEIRSLLAGAYLAEENDEEALRQYRTIVEEAGEDTRGTHWSRYASVLASLQRENEAIREYDAIAERFRDEPAGREALLEAGQLLYTTGDYIAARERFREYRNRYPAGDSIDRALFWGGRSSAALGEGERALLWWDPLIIEYPRSTYTPQALFLSAEIHREAGRIRDALALYDRYVAAFPEGSSRNEAERRRQELRLVQSGLTDREAALWTELEPDTGDPPTEGSDRWFELVLELGRTAIREQITLSFERNRIIPKLQEAAEFEAEGAAEANILLAEYYRRRGETRRAVERYVAAASVTEASDELRAQSLYRLAETAKEEGDLETMEGAIEQLRERYPDTIWADQAERLSGGAR
ncbi:MAG: tetratricopeptide repeat protein [Alkalispirochaeta sp.]